MRNHVIKKLIERAKSDERIILLVGDLGFHVVEEFHEKYPSRFINCGIAEDNMMSVAAGMAMEGDIVFVYSLGNFPTLRCLEQIRNDVCYHNVDVKIISVGGGFSYGSLGMTHHATEELAIMRTLPNMRVYAPADPIEAEAVMDDMVDNSGPCYVRLARGQDITLHGEGIVGSIRRLIPFREYKEDEFDVSIVTAGTILSEGIKVEKRLNGAGIKTRLYSCPVLKPLDKNMICSLATDSKFVVTMEEHNVFGGLGGAFSEVISELRSHGQLIKFGLQDTFSGEVGSQEYLRKYYKIDCETIYNTLLKLVNA